MQPNILDPQDDNQMWSLIEDELLGDPIEDTEDDEDQPIIPAAPPQKKQSEPKLPPQEQENPFKLFASELGVELEDDWDGDGDEFKTILQDKVREEVLESLHLDDPIVDGFIKFVSNGGKPIDFIQAVSTPTLDRMSPEDRYRAYMKATTKLSPDKIERLMEKSKELGEFEDEVQEFTDEMNSIRDEHIQATLKYQEQEKRERQEALRKAAIERKAIVKSKDILGVPITKNAEFEKFYLSPTERVEYDGKTYNVTGYQKRLMERQQNPLQYEALLAYLEFTNFKLLGEETKIRTEVSKDLKSKLQTYYSGNRTTRLIDEG
ncbi:MAG TPA: hypothetical protein PKD00_01695 [Burkholderiales bacterium]|nr:hypothetical protein [Burkholderiales bacterium]